MTDDQKDQIDAMTQIEMARMWRFASWGEPLLNGEAGEYFSEVFKHKGFFTPEISKQIGW